MGIREDLLLGEIALTLKLITPDQLNECVVIQEKEEIPRQLGIILQEKGYLSQAALEKILGDQHQKLLKFMDNSQNKQRSVLFGQMAISRGYLTSGQLNESLREQSNIDKMGIFMHLGEIFVKKSFMQENQVQEILKEQKRLIESQQNEN